MIIEQANYVEAYSIGDAWREVMWLCVKNGYDITVKGGSYVGQIRRQLPFVTIKIIEPWKKPLAPINLPPNIPPPTSDEKIEEYFFEYLMNDEPKENEQYTYGSYIKPQIQKVIEILIKAEGNTNQACMSIGDKNSVDQSDPACLRVMSFKVVGKKLNLSVFFRSWDLVSGLPQNLGGFQKIKEYILASLPEDMGISDGYIIAYSDGLHIYEQYFDLANLLNVDKIKVNKTTKEEKDEFAKILDSRAKMIEKNKEKPNVIYKKECSG